MGFNLHYSQFDIVGWKGMGHSTVAVNKCRREAGSEWSMLTIWAMRQASVALLGKLHDTLFIFVYLFALAMQFN